MQFVTRLVNPLGVDAVRCILHYRELRGVQAFSALIGYFQVLSQRLRAVIWYVKPSVALRSLTTTTESPITSS